MNDSLDHFFDSFEIEAFRLETLPAYAVPQEADDFERFLSGAPAPLRAETEWTSFVSENVGKAKRHLRLRVVPDGYLTPYLLFEIEWHYLLAVAAGEDIRLVARSTIEAPLDGDYWVFDQRVAFKMTYTQSGTFVSAERSADGAVTQIRALRDAVFAQGQTPAEVLAAVRSGRLPIRAPNP